MRLKLFLWVGLPIIITLVSLITAKYYSMSSTISKQEKEIEDLKNKKLVLEVDLKTERANVDILKTTVWELNDNITAMEIRNQKTIQAFNDFKKKSSKEKYTNQQVSDLMHSKLWDKEDGEACLELNRQIAKLKYEDL